MGLQIRRLALLIQALWTVNAQEFCGGKLSQRNGTLSNPSNYSAWKTQVLKCNWTIDTREINSAEHLELRVSSVSLKGFMPNCTHGDYLEVFIGCGGKSVGRFCGVTMLPVFYSTDGCMRVVLHSKDMKAHVSAAYHLRPLNQAIQHIQGGCGVSLHEHSRQGNIFTPLWPLPYPQDVDCIWTVTTRNDLEIKLIFFDFDVRANAPCNTHDYVEIRTGNSGYYTAKPLTETPACGRSGPFTVDVGSMTLYIMFKSDKTTGPRGFMAGFVTYQREQEEFDPQVLIILGVVFLLVILLLFKMIVVPKIITFCKTKVTRKGIKNALTGSPRKISFRRLRSNRQVEDIPVETSSDVPPEPMECFRDDNEVTIVTTCPRDSIHVPCQGGAEDFPCVLDGTCVYCLSPERRRYSDRSSPSKYVRFASEQQAHESIKNASASA